MATKPGTQKPEGPPDEEHVKFHDGRKLHKGVGENRILVARLLHCRPFDNILGTVILIHMLYTVYETDQRARGDKEQTWQAVLETCFLAFYTLEIALRLFVWRLEFFRDTQHVFEFVVVAMDIVFRFLEGLPSVAFIRILRIFRLMRSMRILVHFRELYIMAHGMIAAAKAIFWATVMLAIWLTLWSIVTVEMIHPLNKEIDEQTGEYAGCERCGRAFSSVPQAMLTFTQQIIAGDSWGLVTVPIVERHPWTAIVFFSLLVTINFGLLNLILTVIVDRAAAARDSDVEMKIAERESSYKQIKKELTSICEDMDDDSSGQLTLPELVGGFDHNDSFKKQMMLMDVKKEDFDMVFAILDTDGSGSVTYSEFIEQLHKMKSEDSHMMLTMIRYYILDVRKQVMEFVANSHTEHKETLQTNHDMLIGLLSPEEKKDGAVTEIDNNVKPSNSSLDASFETLKQHVDRQFVAFGRDLALKIDTTSRIAPPSGALPNGSTATLAAQVAQSNYRGIGQSQEFRGKHPAPPSYEGVCGGLVMSDTKGGIS